MPKFLFKGSYSQEGASVILRDGGSPREAAGRAIVESLGGSLESFHFAFGGSDLYAIAVLPDDAAAMALAVSIGSTGRFVSFETIPLFTSEEIDAAVKRVE
jgi:uncharacterized protein with GYD domain